MATKKALDVGKWNAQYQQSPTSEEGAILKREWWRIWEEDKPPPIVFKLVSWDTAFEKNTRADYSACTVWGIFNTEDDVTGKPVQNIILLDAFRDRWEFPELKRTAIKHYHECNPDCVIIEKKANGSALIAEMRRMGLPVQEYTPTKGNDKIARANAVSPIFESGMVWMDTHRFAEEVREECAEFPNGDHDDYVDTVTQAMLRFRKGGFLQLPSDEDGAPRRRRDRTYY